MLQIGIPIVLVGHGMVAVDPDGVLSHRTPRVSSPGQLSSLFPYPSTMTSPRSRVLVLMTLLVCTISHDKVPTDTADQKYSDSLHRVFQMNYTISPNVLHGIEIFELKLTFKIHL